MNDSRKEENDVGNGLIREVRGRTHEQNRTCTE
jgi:hypothetical protein